MLKNSNATILILISFISLKAYAGCPPDGPEAGALGYLNWGPSATPGDGCKIQSKKAIDLQTSAAQANSTDNQAKLTNGILAKAKAELTDPIPIVAVLSIQGHKVSEPAYQQSIAATSALPKVLHFSLCARLAQPPLSQQCQDKASTSIIQWMQTFKPTGDPINGDSFIPLFEAIDVIMPLLDKTVASSVKSWVKSFVTQGDAFFTAQMKGHATEHNNWNTWRLATRAVASTVLNDQGLMAETSQLIHDQIKYNFVRDGNGKTDGTTVDFIERDALHYDIYDMNAWTVISDFTPCLLSADDKTSIQAGFDFLKPYYLGQKTHQEFLHSTVAFDAQRGAAGDPTYQVHTWIPTGGIDDGMNRTLIRLARPAFQSVQSWTNSYVTPSYDPVTKFEAKLFGEPIDSN